MTAQNFVIALLISGVIWFIVYVNLWYRSLSKEERDKDDNDENWIW